MRRQLDCKNTTTNTRGSIRRASMDEGKVAGRTRVRAGGFLSLGTTIRWDIKVRMQGISSAEDYEPVVQ